MQWEPFETAPKDGSQILAYSLEDGRMATMEWIDARSAWSEDQGIWCICIIGAYAEDRDWNPTHWRSLPDPPKA